MTSQPSQQLSQHWAAIYDSTDKSLDWIEEVRTHSLGIDNEADNIKLQVYRHKNLAKNLKKVACTPMTIGFFGLSQAGKSYLISALAADKTGELITHFGHDELNFIDHVNPLGGGQEATGLVTRFSRLAKESPDPAFPVELRLFSEIEIAMVLANAWFNDFDQELIEYEINKALVTEHLAAFANIDTQATPTASYVAVEPEDVVALMDNIGNLRSVSELKHVYWGEAIRLIRHLSLHQRAELFSILWGKQAKITAAYIQLATALQTLGGAHRIYAPLSTLVKKSADSDTGYIQENSIMNVNTLHLLGTAADPSVQVRPVLQDDSLGAPTTVSTAELTALVSEMTFRLVAASNHPVVEKVDLLDFPGYRSRLKKPSLQALSDEKDIIAQLLLRGKVAYLFERYTNAQEMNGLILCASADKQGEVMDIKEALTEWIYKTQGETAEERAKRLPGLIWAMTMADLYVQKAISGNKDQRKESSFNLMNITMLQRFGDEAWIKNWNSQPFNNAFLVRKPRLPTSFIVLDEQNNEVEFTPQSLDALDDLRSGFISNEAVRKHVANPAEAWDAMMSLNNGGIQRLGDEGVEAISDPSFKLQRLTEKLEQTKDEIRKSIGHFYHEDADDVDGIQLEKAKKVVGLNAYLAQVGGELLHLLGLKNETVMDLFLNGDYANASSQDEQQNKAEPIATSSLGGLDDFDFGFEVETAPKQSTVVTHSHEYLFANAVYKAWIAHLRQLALKNSALSRLGIPQSETILPILIEELITASARLNLVNTMAEKLSALAQSNARHEQIAQSYVLNAQLSIQDFIAYAGYLDVDLEQRPKNRNNEAIFHFSNQLHSDTGLPLFNKDELHHANTYFGHWLMGITMMIRENAGHDAGREISMEQNNQLGAILREAGII